MKNIFLLLSAILIIAGCQPSEKPANSIDRNLADVNFYLETDRKIDSVFFSNITQDREFQFMPYSDTLHIKLKDSINDLYVVKFYSGEDAFMSQLWLDGKNLVVKGKLSDKLQVDTVIGSPLYYHALAYRKKYREVMDSGAGADSVNNFLFKQLAANMSSPLSNEIASQLYHKNINNKPALARLFELMTYQPEVLQDNLTSPYKQLEKALTLNKIDLREFSFFGIDDKLVSINPEKGKKYLVDFWFMECAPCLADHKIIKEKKELLASKNVEVIGVSIDNSQDEWKEFLKHKNYTWKNLREIDDHEKTLRNKFLISLFPTYLLLDDQGNILQRTNSFEEISKYF